MIYPDLFSVSQAHAEGWDLGIDDDGRYAIEQADEVVGVMNRGAKVREFRSDADVVAFVRKKAKRSAFHAYALSLHGSPVPPEILAEWEEGDSAEAEASRAA